MVTAPSDCSSKDLLPSGDSCNLQWSPDQPYSIGLVSHYTGARIPRLSVMSYWTCITYCFKHAEARIFHLGNDPPILLEPSFNDWLTSGWDALNQDRNNLAVAGNRGLATWNGCIPSAYRPGLDMSHSQRL